MHHFTGACLIRIISEVKPTEIYNLAAMSHVKISFQTAEYTADVDGVGTLRLVEAIRTVGINDKEFEKQVILLTNLFLRLRATLTKPGLFLYLGSILPSIYLGIIRKSQGSSTKRNDSVLS